MSFCSANNDVDDATNKKLDKYAADLASANEKIMSLTDKLHATERERDSLKLRTDAAEQSLFEGSNREYLKNLEKEKLEAVIKDHETRYAKLQKELSVSEVNRQAAEKLILEKEKMISVIEKNMSSQSSSETRYAVIQVEKKHLEDKVELITRDFMYVRDEKAKLELQLKESSVRYEELMKNMKAATSNLQSCAVDKERLIKHRELDQQELKKIREEFQKSKEETSMAEQYNTSYVSELLASLQRVQEEVDIRRRLKSQILQIRGISTGQEQQPPSYGDAISEDDDRRRRRVAELEVLLQQYKDLEVKRKQEQEERELKAKKAAEAEAEAEAQAKAEESERKLREEAERKQKAVEEEFRKKQELLKSEEEEKKKKKEQEDMESQRKTKEQQQQQQAEAVAAEKSKQKLKEAEEESEKKKRAQVELNKKKIEDAAAAASEEEKKKKQNKQQEQEESELRRKKELEEAEAKKKKMEAEKKPVAVAAPPPPVEEDEDDPLDIDDDDDDSPSKSKQSSQTSPAPLPSPISPQSSFVSHDSDQALKSKAGGSHGTFVQFGSERFTGFWAQYHALAKVRSLKWTFKTIGQLWKRKIDADRIDDREGTKRAALPEFLLEDSKQMFGSPHLFRESMVSLVESAFNYSDQHVCASFVNLLQETWGESILNLYTATLFGTWTVLKGSLDASSQLQIPDLIVDVSEDGPLQVTLPQAKKVITTVLAEKMKGSSQALEALKSAVSQEYEQVSSISMWRFLHRVCSTAHKLNLLA